MQQKRALSINDNLSAHYTAGATLKKNPFFYSLKKQPNQFRK